MRINLIRDHQAFVKLLELLGLPQVLEPVSPQRLIHVPGAASTIQAGLDLATPGDRVLVGPGVWAEAIHLKEGVELVSSLGPEHTILAGTGGLSIVRGDFVSRDTHLRGFTLQAGSAGSACGIELAGAFPRISECVFSGTFGPGTLLQSGAISSTWYGSPLVERCRFDGDESPGSNGAAWPFYFGEITFRDCLFSGYTAPSVVEIDTGSVALINCTVVDNLAAAVSVGSGRVLVWNSIRRNRAAAELLGRAASFEVAYSNVRGGAPGAGNMDLDPNFAGPGDYRLAPGSVCIDAGNSNLMTAMLVLSPPTRPSLLDLEGHPRVVDDPQTPDSGVGTPFVVDLGSFEFGAASPGL